MTWPSMIDISNLKPNFGGSKIIDYLMWSWSPSNLLWIKQWTIGLVIQVVRRAEISVLHAQVTFHSKGKISVQAKDAI